VVHHPDQQYGVNHCYGDGAGEEQQSLEGGALESDFAAQHQHHSCKGECHADDERGLDALAVGEPHTEGDEEGDGGYDHRGQRAADEAHAVGLTEVVDEGLAESEEKEPFDVLSADALQAMGKGEGWQHDCRGDGQA